MSSILHDPNASKLFLIDGHSMAFRAFYALRAENFQNSQGQHTNAVYGFANMLASLFETYHPSHCVVAFDVSRKTLLRTQKYPEYKATRSATPEEFAGQIDLISRFVDSLNIPRVSLEGHEADDVIATLATEAAQEDVPAFIVTGDRDALQLVSDNISVLYPKKGASDLVHFTPEQVQEKYGVTPVQYADLAALRGDSSDNLPGVPGVGEKTAMKWVNAYGDLAGVIANADNIKGKVGQSFRDHMDNVLRNREMTALVRDLPLGIDVESLKRVAADATGLFELCDELSFGNQFRSRMSRAFAVASTGETDVAEEQPGDIVWASAEPYTPGGLTRWLDCDRESSVSLVLNGRFTPRDAELSSFALYRVDEAGAASSFFAHSQQLSAEDSTSFAEFISHPLRPKVFHDSKAAWHALQASGYTLEGFEQPVFCDVSIAAYLVRPGERSYALDKLAMRHCGIELPDRPEDKQLSLLDDGEDTGDELADFSVRCAAVLNALAVRLRDELRDIDSLDLLCEIEQPLARVLARSEKVGIAVDSDYLDQLGSTFLNARNHAEADAFASIEDVYEGEPINLASPKQLQKVLFETLDMPKTKKTKTGYTTDASALEDLLVKTQHPFLQALMRHREVTKLRTTVQGLQKVTDPDDRIRGTFNQTVTSTGRLSSTDPNLQNIPVRTAEGRDIRKGFVAGTGFDGLLTADYSQIEMRVMAHLSGDTGLIEAFRSGEDLHNYVGSQAFNVPIDEVTDDLRRRVKAMSYGLVYGLSAYGLANQLKISPGEAKLQMEAYFDRFGGVRDYLQDVVAQARINGYTETVCGRRRYLPELNSERSQIRENAERAALNAPIQGSAADIIKEAMLRVDRALTEADVRSRLLLQVHDELVLEVVESEREQVTELVQHHMSAAFELSVPLSVSIGYGRSWDDAAH